MAGDALIRTFETDDAERVGDLLYVLAPATLATGELLRHRQASEPERSRGRMWVAVEGDEIVGFASAHLQWYGGEAGRGRIWCGVSEEHRRKGIGTALWESAVAHLGGVRKLTVEIDDDPDGLRFVERRGFTQYDAEVMSVLDPRAFQAEPKPHEGFRVVGLAEARDRANDLYGFYGAAGGLNAGDPANHVTFDEWRRFILDSPILDDDTSVVVVDEDDRIVSLSWLLVDADTGRAENEWTATLPEFRGRGLARLAKVVSIRLAAERRITEIITGNDPDNLPMRELNRRLGYRELFTRRDMEKAVERAPEAPAT